MKYFSRPTIPLSGVKLGPPVKPVRLSKERNENPKQSSKPKYVRENLALPAKQTHFNAFPIGSDHLCRLPDARSRGSCVRMGNYVSLYLTNPKGTPLPLTEPSFDPNLGFPHGRKERGKRERAPAQFRRSVAHRLAGLSVAKDTKHQIRQWSPGLPECGRRNYPQLHNMSDWCCGKMIILRVKTTLCTDVWR